MNSRALSSSFQLFARFDRRVNLTNLRVACACGLAALSRAARFLFPAALPRVYRCLGIELGVLWQVFAAYTLVVWMTAMTVVGGIIPVVVVIARTPRDCCTAAGKDEPSRNIPVEVC